MSKNNVLHIKLVITMGFAMFAMFFGSGNLVFPIIVGYESQGFFWTATVGLWVTAIVVPFLGLYGLLLYNGSYDKFFASLDRYSGFIVPLFILAIIGPLGVLPRTFTVAYGSFVTLVPGTPVWLFSSILAAIVFVLVYDSHKVVSYLGLVLTPLLLVLIFVVVAKAIILDPQSAEQITTTSYNVFYASFITGYHTMDLLGAFFFAYVIVKYIHNKITSQTASKYNQKAIVLQAIILAMLLLAIVYTGFVYLGMGYADYLDMSVPAQSLPIIAKLSLGQYGAIIVSATIIVAILTTAVALTVVSADYIKTKVARNKINHQTAAIIALVIATLVSLLDFTGIMAFLGPILEVVYPVMIVFTVLTILAYHTNYHWIRIPVYATFVISLIYYLLPGT